MSNEITNRIEKPAYLTDPELNKPDELIKEMQTYVSPPRLKVVQSTSGAPFKPTFAEGDILVLPEMLKVGDTKTAFEFVPLAVFPMFIATNPFQLKNSLPFIRERSFDEDSDVARKARAFLRVPCPEDGKYQIVYQTTLNFLIRIEKPQISAELPVALMFRSMEFKVGQILLTLLQERRAKSFYCRFQAGSLFQSTPKGNYYGLSVMNAPEPWVAEDKVSQYTEEAKVVRELIQSRRIELDLEDSDVSANDEKF